MDAEHTTDTTTEQETTERDELLAAVREAGGTDAARDAVAAEAVAAGDPPPAAPDTPEEEPRVLAVIKAREKAAAEREAARNQAEELINRSRAEAERILQEARDRAEREAQAEKDRLIAQFRSNPTATLRALGDPQEISDAIMREGTPEARHIRMLEERLAATEKRAEAGERVSKELESFRTELQQARQAEYLDKIRTDYMATATQDKAPHLNALYSSEEIFHRANAVAADWRKRGAVLGEDFDFGDVTRHLEADAKKRFSSLNGAQPAQQVSAGAPAKEPGNAPKVTANGSRTLSAAQGSERRTSPKPLSEMSADEARQALIEEVAAARRAHPDAKL